MKTAFYIAQSADIDRYCKMAVHFAFPTDFISTTFYSSFLNGVQVVNGLREPGFIPQFQNVPYLRRFRVNGTISIASFVNSFELQIGPCTESNSNSRDYLPEIQLETNIASFHHRHHRHSLSVDTMLLDGHILVCLHVTSGASGPSRASRFESMGHYPILAGYDFSGDPLYVAAICVEYLWYFTCVKDSSSIAIYTDEVGDRHSTHDFFVLALRHNPSDLPSPYPRPRSGSMDPTGPVFWLKLWPEKDPDYYDDVRLSDDQHLVSFLNESCIRNCKEDEILSGL